MISWRNITHPAARLISRKLETILDSWADTPYMAGNQAKGPKGGVDCVRFVAGVLDELYGYQRVPLPRLPQDISLHDRAGAMKAMKLIRRIYDPNEPVLDEILEPGDIVVVGAEGGGPGHAMIVGARENELWHSTGERVQMTGIGFLWATYHSFRFCAAYRCLDREKWV